MYLIVICEVVSKDNLLNLMDGLLNPCPILFDFQLLHLGHLDLFLIPVIFHHSNSIFQGQNFECISQICLKMDIITGKLSVLIQ